MAKSDIVGLVIAAETSGLLGVSLRRSPAIQKDGGGHAAPFGFPAVREWLSYSPERTHARSLTLVAGIVARNDSHPRASSLFSMIRPLGPAQWPAGHFHAAAFSYRPIEKGVLDLKKTTAGLFERQNLQSVVHLLNDTRQINGAGESEFVRGAFWVGSIAAITERIRA
jgi:hypothetical protein